MTTAARLHADWRGLPIGALDDVIGTGSCLILAPHPDDESLGCGGLIAACCAAARPPLVVILTDGSASHPGSTLYPPARLAAVRESEAAAAVLELGLPPDRLSFLREPDAAAPCDGSATHAIAQRLARDAQEASCSAILAPWRHDPHGDHQAASHIANMAAHIAAIRLVEYPVWGWTLAGDTELAANVVRGWRLDITAHLPAKRHAIAAHVSQYGGLITDDPRGFELPEALLRACDQPWETFLLP